MRSFILFLGCACIPVLMFSSNNCNSKHFPASCGGNCYRLVWEDEFNGNVLDETNNWSIEDNGSGNGNAELQYYKRENISLGTEPVSGEKCMIITARRENYLGKVCTSGKIKTLGKMSFKHGLIEARIKMPHTANGLWPAFWMMGADYSLVGWPRCGEIDILEMGKGIGIDNGTQERFMGGWCHWGEGWNSGSYPNWGKDSTMVSSVQDDFHLFTLTWDDHFLKMYIDLDKNPTNSPYMQMAIDGPDSAGNAARYFHKKFFVIFDLAVGGNFTQIWDVEKVTALNHQNNYEAKMYVDYVKIYQKGVDGEEYDGPSINNIKVKTDTLVK